MKKRLLNIKKRDFQILLLILFMSVGAQLIPITISSLNNSSANTFVDSIPNGCTVFTLSKGDQVFFGGNDDYIESDSYFWVDPSGIDRYGAIWIGLPDNVQQGVNEMGLAYDANGLPRVDVNSHPERQPVSGGYTSYPIQILRECATVTEVIEWVKTHRWHTYMHDQMQFADASGDAVIISAGTDNELVFTRKPQGDGFLVSTNFNVANPNNGFGYPCWRYQTAQEVLVGLLNQEGELSYRDAVTVLDAVHVDSGTSWTIESLVADLSNGLVYLFYFHQFDNPVVLVVAEEIVNPRASGPLSDLFPEDVQQEAALRFQRIQAQAGRLNMFGMAWLGIVIISIVLYLILSRNQSRGRIFWGSVVFILGPLALMAWLVAGGRRRSGTLRVVLVEAVGDVAPTVIAFLIYIAVVLLFPEAGAISVQVALIFGLPFVVGWLFFQGLLLSRVSEKGYVQVLYERLPQVLVTANLGMAGIIAIASPLIAEGLVGSLSGWSLAYYWAVIVFGAVVSVLLLMVYEVWARRLNILSWGVLSSEEGEIVSPTWRQLWWWIILSYVALFGGILVSVLLQQL
jgi:hypothetical protein